MSKPRKKTDQELTFNFAIIAIELIGSSLSLPSKPDISLERFNFNINIETKIETKEQLIIVIPNIDIRTEDESEILGNIKLSCIFKTDDLGKISAINADGKVQLIDEISNIFTSISISTSRGVLFSTFKGTFLQNAILPVIDPKLLTKINTKWHKRPSINF